MTRMLVSGDRVTATPPTIRGRATSRPTVGPAWVGIFPLVDIGTISEIDACHSATSVFFLPFEHYAVAFMSEWSGFVY